MPDAHVHDHPGEDLLDLDAEVLHDYWSSAMTWVHDLAAGSHRGRILDLGAGTGTGALALAGHFPDAEVVAVDISAESLHRLRAKAADRGMSARTATVEADLDRPWPEIGEFDLTWASMSLHHLADPGRVLRDVRAATRPGGLIAVAEFPEPLRFLPEDLGVGRPGFEARVSQTLQAAHTELMPTIGTDWAPRLASAGWRVLDERTLRIDLRRPHDATAARYARAWFTRLAHGLDDRLDPADRPTLQALLAGDGPNSLLGRVGLHIRGTRTVTVAARPDGAPC